MRKLVTILFTVLAVSAGARQISPEEAAAVASAFFNPASRSSEKVAVSRAQNNATATNTPQPYYVFNSEDDRGFVIVSGDDRTLPILGYSDSGNFDFNNLPPQLEWLLGEYTNEIETLASSPDTSAYTATADDTRAPIEPLIKTHWGQDEPFNNSCPLISGERAVTGCVATALAQVMNYHKWPERGQGTHSYEYNGETYSIDFSQIKFDWDAMLDDYDSDSSERSKDAVATLMKACGYGVNMEYGTAGSGGSAARTMGIEKAARSFFDYSDIANYIEREDYTSEEWESIIYAQLSQGLPVLYYGRDKNGGHSFICDGYQGDGYFHFNWGWYGMADGYFLMSTGQNIDLNGYNINQGCIVNLFPSNKRLDCFLSDGTFIYQEIGNDTLVLIGATDNNNNNNKLSGDVILPDQTVISGKNYAVSKIICSIRNLLDTVNPISLDIRTPITAIPYWEFQDMKNLKSIKFPSTLLSIGFQAFANCSGLTGTLTIPESVTSIEGNAFFGCSGFTGDLIIPNSVTSIEFGAFYECKGFNGELFIPNSVTSIGNNAFMYCHGFTGELIIPNSVTSIGRGAFWGCIGFTGELVIPNSVTSIKDNAFYDCSFSTINCISQTPPSIETTSFSENTFASAKLNVPEDALESYRNHAVWSLFKSLSYIYPTQIVLDLTEWEGTEGDQIQLSVTVSPDDATDKTVTWSSSNASVAEVDANGLVTAIAPGTAKITATTTNGIEAICTVTVYAKSGLIDIISGDDVSVTTCDGEIIVKAHDGTQVEVFTPAGVLVARTTEHRITGLSTGIYIVHVCGKVVKVRI